MLTVLLRKNNSYFPAKDNLPIHIVFCISSIFRIKVLDKAKSSRLPSIVIPWNIYIFKAAKLSKWPTKVFWPAVPTKVPDQKTGWEISTSAHITNTGTWAACPSSVASWWWGWTVAVASSHVDRERFGIEQRAPLDGRRRSVASPLVWSPEEIGRAHV